MASGLGNMIGCIQKTVRLSGLLPDQRTVLIFCSDFAVGADPCVRPLSGVQP